MTLHTTGKDNYFLSVELRSKLERLAQDDAMDLMRAAHEVCPYSKATRGNIEVKLFVD